MGGPPSWTTAPAPSSPAPHRGTRSEPPRLLTEVSRHDMRADGHFAELASSTLDPFGASLRTRSCSHDTITAGSHTLMRSPGAEPARIDDAPTPSAFELEMSSPLSKSREHRSRDPKPSRLVVHSEEHAGETSSYVRWAETTAFARAVPTLRWGATRSSRPCLHPRLSRPTRVADLPSAESALTLLVVFWSPQGWNHPGPRRAGADSRS